MSRTVAVEKQEFQRLGKRELGKYAFERQMPAHVASALENENRENSMAGVIANIAKLLEHAEDVSEAFLCSDHTAQVWKLRDEGPHFCGYRNIQMSWSALATSQTLSRQLPKTWPTIPELQVMIEHAWDAGFNAHGKILTGGISGTRKHIGTSEVEALLLSLDIPCIGKTFLGKDAWKDLLDSIEAYFRAYCASPATRTVTTTDRSPIFLQRPQHSLTIVGIERLHSGRRRLITFDPAWSGPSKMATPLRDDECSGWSAKWLLRRYRKTQRYLKRFNAFETLEL